MKLMPVQCEGRDALLEPESVKAATPAGEPGPPATGVLCERFGVRFGQVRAG
jgi:hypothetical protein